MFLPQRSLQTVTIWAILFFACFAMCQDLENRRAVTEHQLMHDKGRAAQGLKRLRWLQLALGAVHTAGSSDIHIPLPSAGWGVHESQDPAEFNSSHGDEASSRMKQLLEPMEAQGFLPLNGKFPKGNWNPQHLFDPL